MDKNFTRITEAQTSSQVANGPRKKTLDFIRQFARIYMPVQNMPGVVLN